MESTGHLLDSAVRPARAAGFRGAADQPVRLQEFRRKTDVSDCQWLQTLHTFGLLPGSFRPHEKIVTLRSYLRHRDNLVKCATDEVRRMQKALEQMNVKLTEVLSDHGGDGAGDHPGDLGGRTESAAFGPTAGTSVRENDVATIALALEGNWRSRRLPCVKGWSVVRDVPICRNWRNWMSESGPAWRPSRIEAHPLAALPRNRALEPKSEPPRLDAQTDGRGFDGGGRDWRPGGLADHLGDWHGHEQVGDGQTFCELVVFVSGVATDGRQPEEQAEPHATGKNRAAAVFRMGAQSLLKADCALGVNLGGGFGPRRVVRRR